jgi:hypothetical protein
MCEWTFITQSCWHLSDGVCTIYVSLQPNPTFSYMLDPAWPLLGCVYMLPSVEGCCCQFAFFSAFLWQKFSIKNTSIIVLFVNFNSCYSPRRMRAGVWPSVPSSSTLNLPCFLQFPNCDGSHVAHNKDTGDNVGPLIVTKAE